MKKIVTIVVLICMLSLVLSGCGNTTVSLGTYQNENNAEEQVIITESTIKFVNVSFDDFNEELRQDMGVDLRLTEFMSDENAYTLKDGVLSVDIGTDIAVSFEYGKDYIKPIFQSTLFDLFMTLTDGKIAKPKSDPQLWDFTGKRILLVEDNVLNQIVAKGYLSKYNIVVDVAMDGKKALEMFESSEPGYYDAILMDIQMPVMDGYEATRAIRASSHPEAKTIQIIAQSADAFNEDIAKALSAGMNAHVAKPIKPDILAKTLYMAFNREK